MTAQANGRYSPSNSPVSRISTGDQEGPRAERSERGKSPESLVRSDTLSDRVGGFLSWVRDFFVPPQGLLEAPASWSELSAYARRNARLENAPALVRTLSLVWLYAVTLPTVAAARLREWVLSRPARALLFLGVAELFLRTTPMGHWIAATVRQWFAVLAWIFLP